MLEGLYVASPGLVFRPRMPDAGEDIAQGRRRFGRLRLRKHRPAQRNGDGARVGVALGEVIRQRFARDGGHLPPGRRGAQ